GLLETDLGLFEIEHVNAVALGEDVRAHLRVPPLGEVTEVHAGIEHFLNSGCRHVCKSFRRCGDQRFENWKLRRAPALPYFLRSTARLSRVSRPCSRMSLRSSSSWETRARAMPRRTAPPWPEMPPPLAETNTSHSCETPATARGCSAIISRMALR